MKPLRPEVEAAPEGSAHREVSLGTTLARGAFFNTLALLTATLRGIFMLLVARLLGSGALGVFVLAWAAMDLLCKFATLGLDYTATAFVAKSEAGGDRARSRRILRVALVISFSSGLVLAAAGFFASWFLGPRLGLRPELARAAAVMMGALPFLAVYRVSNALSRGMGVMHHDIFSRGLTESLVTAAALLIALSLGARALAPEVAAMVGTMGSAAVAFFLARRLFVSRKNSAVSPSDNLPQRLFSAALPIAFSDLLNAGIMNIDLIILGWFVGRAPGVTLATLGIYAAAVELAGGLRKVSQSFTPIFMPVAAAQIASGKIREAEASYGYLARWMLALLLPAVILLALSGGAILMIFGAGFQRGAVWLAVAGIACAVGAFVSLGETLLIIERPRLNLLNSATAFAVAVGLNFLLIPAFGPLGAAFGMLVPYTLLGLMRGWQISSVLDWHWPWRALLKPWWAAIMPLPVALAARFFARDNLWPLAPGVLYLAGYFLAWRIIGLDAGDRAILDRLFARKRVGLTSSRIFQPTQPQ